ncbi:MAG TPA: hypothetical protein VFU19_10795 [Iamia sp.]|nr:hypothetical protein [Iamia sp.]
MSDPGSDADAGSASLEVRPPTGPTQVMAVVAAGSAVLAVLGIVSGEVLVGLVALVSAGWLGSVAFIAATAWSRADATGLAVSWMRRVEEVPWADVAAVEVARAGAGGMRQGALVVRRSAPPVRWAPWFPFLWFTHRSVTRSVDDLDALLATLDVGVRVTDPDAPDDDTPTWTRAR